MQNRNLGCSAEGKDSVVKTDTHIPVFSFDPAALAEAAGQHADAYRCAQPFPHVVLEEFLPDWVIATVVAEFPRPGDIEWDLYTDAGNTQKLATHDEQRMGPFTRQLIAQLNGGPFLRFLETLTGIQGLVPDPHLLGGGLHRIERGGFLRVHADFNRHLQLRLDRRLNLLLYLNQGWQEAWGGHLELWNRVSCRRSILPVANRCVIFSTTDDALHGHPKPLECPPAEARKSIALYYYSNGRPEHERSPDHSTLYLQPVVAGPSQSRLKETAQRWLPPALVDLYSRQRWRRR